MALPLLPVLSMGNANQPLDHPYTLRNQNPYLLEAEYHRMIESDKPRSYIFPRPCFSEVDSSDVCPELGGWGSEQHEDPIHPSYDREFAERQDVQASSSFAYSSYSRYRSNLSYDWSWGRLSVAWDAVHWGPVTVQSLYGQLAASRNWEFDTSSNSNPERFSESDSTK